MKTVEREWKNQKMNVRKKKIIFLSFLKCLLSIKYGKIEDTSFSILNIFADLALFKDWLNFDGRPLKNN